MATDARNELTTLRISVARVAQAMGVDNDLRVTGAAYEALRDKAQTQERGWNDLAGRCHEKALEFKAPS